MFRTLGNLSKAVISIAVTPVTAVADAAMLIADAEGDKDAFNRTGAMLSNAGECMKEAVKPSSED